MKYTTPVLYLLLCLLFNTATQAQKTIFPTPLSPRIANYEINVVLDHDKRTIKGYEKLNWRNTSTDVITELQFHMYLNAFKNNKSTFAKEGGIGIGVPIDDSAENIWGWVNIEHFEDADGNDLVDDIEYIQPDDDNQQDQTVIRVPLRKPLQPGEELNVTIDFTSKLPRLMARTGYAGDYYLVAQWFPKIGVYEAAGVRYAEEGQWNCHQFHSRSEFYADFGVYDVKMTVPSDFVVGASGSLQKVEDNGANKTWSFHAEDVIDFAWTASPDFMVLKKDWEHVEIRLYLQPEHQALGQRYLTSAVQSLEYFAEHVGKYPYPTLSIVDPTVRGAQSSGMEYPNFITGISFHGLPEGLRMVETVTVHEFGHQYFMQMLATNEFEESWLDEGFNTYFEGRLLDHYYGPKSSSVDIFGFRYGGVEGARADYVGMNNPKISENFRYVWEFKHGGYSDLTYNKTATWLRTLEGLVGLETMTEIMKTYFERWKFKHPCADDFIAIVNEVVIKNHGDQFGPNMNWFFDQVLYGSDVCDYKVSRIENKELIPQYGVGDDLSTWVSGTKTKKEWLEKKENYKGPYESRVILLRKGEVIMPQEILVIFDNGDKDLQHWDGQSRSFEVKYTRNEKIVSAILDPDEKIYMDLNLNDNSYTTKPNKTALWKYAEKFLFWMQSTMQSVSFLI